VHKESDGFNSLNNKQGVFLMESAFLFFTKTTQIEAPKGLKPLKNSHFL